MRPDVLVVGAGPAGVAAALWARSLDLTARVIEGGPAPGGQLHRLHFHPANLAGVPEGDGAAIAAAMARQLAEAGIAVECGVEATALEGEPLAPLVRTARGERLEAGAVLAATGMRRRRLEVPGERELEDRGVSTSATRDRARFAGRAVAVAGGGDAAFENALILAAAGCRVTLVVRGAARARAEFRARVAAEPRITCLTGTRITAVLGEDRVRALALGGPAGGRTLEVEGLVIKAGSLPNSEWLAGALSLDAAGFVPVDAGLRTAHPRLWAAGDLTRPRRPSISSALGQAAAAMAAIRAALRGE